MAEKGAQRGALVRKRRATAADVAELAGVSTSAVSRTFTNGASVSIKTRRRVIEASTALDYRPNQLARSLATNRSFIVGVAMTHLDNQFYPQVLEQLSDQLGAEGYRVLLFVTHGSTDLDPVLDELLRYQVDALVLASSSQSLSLGQQCQDAGVPVIMLNSASANSPITSVSAANVAGGRAVAHFLLAGEHFRFAFMAGVEDSFTSREREQSFTAALQKAGVPPPIRVSGDYSFQGAAEAARSLFSAREPIDALFCANDHMALAALQTARAEFGLEPGRGVSIVGFDNVPIGEWPAFRLTTYSQPVQQMVERTVSLIKAVISGDGDAPTHCAIEGELIVRDTARIPAHGVTERAGVSVWRG